MEEKIFLLLGGNQGDRLKFLADACALIGKTAGNILAKSSIHSTAAWGVTDQPDFFNQAIAIKSTDTPKVVLQKILTIEKQLGRIRDTKWGPRTIDIDILLWGDEIIQLPDLQIPHPELTRRRFALTPLNEIASDVIHPQYNKTIRQLLQECPDPLTVKNVIL